MEKLFRSFRAKRAGREAGNAMLAALVASTLVAGSAVYAYKNFNLTQDTLRHARIKNVMSVVEGQLRRRALQPDAYAGCLVTGTESCHVNLAFFSDLERKVPGAQCLAGPGAACGIKLDLSLDAAAKIFAAKITYEGLEARLKPIEFTLAVPTEVLQADSFHCGRIDPAKPIFVGFDAGMGRPLCEGFRNSCGPGEFVSGVNLNQRTLTCRSLPAQRSCAPEMFHSLAWRGSALDFTCRNRDVPPFVSNLTVRYPAQNPEPDRTPPRIDVVTVTQTQTDVAVVTETATQTATPPPPLTPPTCRTESVALGAGAGSTPKVFGNFACLASCQGTFGMNTYCAGGCYQGARDWMYCGDCREDRQVCN